MKLTEIIDRLTSHKLNELQTEVTIMACDVLFSDVSSHAGEKKSSCYITTFV